MSSASEAVKSLSQHLEALRELLAVSSLAFECKTADIEWVYIEERDGQLLVSDRGELMKFFSVPHDDTGSPRSTHVVSFEADKEICELAGAELVPVDGMFPHITIDSRSITDPREAVRVVSRAADRVAASAHSNGWGPIT